MIHKITLIVEDPLLLGNNFFSDDISVIRDNQNACFAGLRNKLLEHNIDLSTEDINSIEEAEIVIRFNVDENFLGSKNHKNYLIIQEPPTVLEKNWDTKLHSEFDRVFTWNESIVDNKKYFLYNLAYDYSSDFRLESKNKKKLCVMIAGYKDSKHELELYSERINTLNWFLKYHPNEIDLYGPNWPEYIFNNRIVRNTRFNYYLRKCLPNIFIKLFAGPNRIYGGKIESKRAVLCDYKFSICYENMHNVNGYITEKIFDSFSAGCVPIYWGANDIGKFIPANCFVDRRSFKSIQKLYNYISSISEKEYMEYLINIRTFLKSDAVKIFSVDYFAETFTHYILRDIFDQKKPCK